MHVVLAYAGSAVLALSMRHDALCNGMLLDVIDCTEAKVGLQMSNVSAAFKAAFPAWQFQDFAGWCGLERLAWMRSVGP